MKTRYLIISFIWFLTISSFSQEENKQKFMIFGVPQYLITNGLRIDIDLHKKETQNWLVISPYFYSDNSSIDPLNLSGGDDDNYDLYSYDKMIGAGLGLQKKIFLSKKSYTSGFYLAFGGTYKYFNIDGNSFTWVEYTGDDGLKYQQMEDIKYKLYIHSLNANATIGYQYQFIDNLYIDCFMGFGIKYSYHNSPDNVMVKYNRGNIDYGYTGTQFVAGVRFGIDLCNKDIMK